MMTDLRRLTSAFSLGIALVASPAFATQTSCPGLFTAPTKPAENTSNFEREADFRSSVQPAIRADQAMLKRMEEDGTTFYFEQREKAQDALSRGRDFPFNAYLPILNRISKDLRIRKSRKFGDRFESKLETIARKADDLARTGAPYRETVNFIMYQYLPMLDEILVLRHPDLVNSSYHRHHAEHTLPSFLDMAPDLFLIFSFEDVGPNFFTHSRPAPLQLVGLDLRGLDDDLAVRPHADKFDMKNSEFAWHDIGHVDFMARKDLAYIQSDTKPIERVVWEWTHTKNRIASVIEQARAKDSVLAASMTELISELMHERGFQYSLSVLKQELETSRWVEVILKKWHSHFYDKLNPDARIFDHLEEARTLLLKAVVRFKEEDQLKWIDALHALDVPVRVTYAPPLVYSKGQPVRIEIGFGARVQVTARTLGGEVQTTPIQELVSAQVNPTAKKTLDREVVSRIAKLLTAGESHQVVTLRDGRSIEVAKVVILADHSINVLTTLNETVALSQVARLQVLPVEENHLSNLAVFEIEQVLGTADRHELSAYTLRAPQQTFTSKVTLERDLVHGTHVIDVRDSKGQIHRLPLADVRIDPLR